MLALPEAFNVLANFKQFILYVVRPSKSRIGKNDKFPVDHRTGNWPVSAHDAIIWMTANEAIAKLASGVGEGIGFVFTDRDPFWLLDIDGCYDPTTQTWSSAALEMLSLFPDAAVEISCSGKGLHIIGSGIVPEHRTEDTLGLHLEFYSKARFVALTGIGARGNAGTDYSHILPRFTAQYFPPVFSIQQKQELTTAPCVEWRGSIDDDELIQRALRSKSATAVFGDRASFKDLWEANTEVLSAAYPDDTDKQRSYNESRADMALAQHLAFWTGKNGERILRIMFRSALVRDKWNRSDYLENFTIPNACALCTEVCVDKPVQEIERIAPMDSSPRCEMKTGNTFLSATEQIEMFRGCSYVRDEHKVLIPGGYLINPDRFRAHFGGFSFQMDLRNERVSKNAWEAFIESQAFTKPVADSSCFRPDKEPGLLIEDNDRKLSNTWWPLNTPRKAGDTTPFINHLKKTIPDERDALIFLSYMCAIVQHKGIKFQWCPLIQGVPGNGKTLFSLCVAYAVGDKYSHFPTVHQITEKFNAWLHGIVFIGVEDIYTKDGHEDVLEILKPMITAKRYTIRAMQVAGITKDICCNFILNSNHKDGIRKTKDDRRFAPFYTAQQNDGDLLRDGMIAEYFCNLYRWLNLQNGFAIVSEFLHTFKIPDEFNPAHGGVAPITSSTHEAIEYSRGVVEQEILEAIAQGRVGFRGGWVSSLPLNTLLERQNLSRRIPHNRRREVLQSLGYDWHPGLHEGRTNNIVMIDGGKPRLFIRHDHSSKSITCAAEIARRYQEAQQEQI